MLFLKVVSSKERAVGVEHRVVTIVSHDFPRATSSRTKAKLYSRSTSLTHERRHTTNTYGMQVCVSIHTTTSSCREHAYYYKGW
jgi:hypothetical protein